MLDAGVGAPEFVLRDLEGRATRLSDLCSSGPVVIAFFKVSCPTCQLAFPFLERMNRNRADDAPRIVAISQDSSVETREFHAEFGISLPTLLDPEEGEYAASNAYGISNVPSMFLVETGGRISWTSCGFSRKDLQQLAQRMGAEAFQKGDHVPEWKPG